MSEVEISLTRAEPVPLPENITSVQPGSGRCFQMEMAWGRLRRWSLKTFRPGYVRRMADARKGDPAGAPHEVLDPRDLKFCCNLCDLSWDAADDRFAWRERIPFARWGFAELQIMGWPLLFATVGLVLLGPPSWFAAAVPGALLGLVVYFFRDPPRRVPTGDGMMVSPADGKIAEITELEHDEFIGGPAVRIGIFLSIFSVHINRVPTRSRVIELRYSPGEFLNALRPESALRNENMWLGFEDAAAPYRKYVVRQISGVIARRIVCAAKPGEVLERGEKFGMIKLGSRTELILPLEDGLHIGVSVGDHVTAGSSVLAEYRNQSPQTGQTS